MELQSDTSKEAEAIQIEIWRVATVQEKIDMVIALTTAATELAIAGIRYNSPNISAEEERYQLSARRYGEAKMNTIERAKQMTTDPFSTAAEIAKYLKL